MASASTRTIMKWQNLEETKQHKSMTRPCEYATSSSFQEQQGTKNVEEDNEEDFCSSGCATPKGKRFRIPEVLTCPSAPKKRRVMPNCSSNRPPITFFASPDIELFFFSALRNVSA
ncbi:cyclin-dependent protein kinase inhibitor SMR9-like [Abrus precatorius]|uniref:Cyclin-dependent protein kinase inhibitor SMR9-like n=1 Tax=Abrus precatorius TaxID=3816 RepID=A0A8B8L4F4_ABRPR|nr:cyclin-dependent protein kinase inhibitor SMR9-like [Abrus precatorius]